MRVLIIGDVHGLHGELADALRQVQSDYGIAAAIQIGDFGFFGASMKQLERERIRFPVPLHVIDGNHEDHAWLRKAIIAGGARGWKEKANLIYQPRASTEQLGASTVGFLGGALHVDRPQEHNMIARLPNYILKRQRQKATAMFNRKKPDLIVTHSCPAGIGIGMRGADDLACSVAEHVVAAGFDPGPDGDCGETELKKLWLDLNYAPSGWVFGHFHCAHDVVVKDTRFVCVGDDLAAMQQRIVLWDTEEKKLLTVRA